MAKILIVANSLSPIARERGRVGQQFGHQISWFSWPKASLPEVKSFAAPKLGGRVGRMLTSPFALAGAIRKSEPDLIHVHFGFQGLRTFILRSFCPVVVSVWGRDVLPEQGGLNSVTRPLLKQLLDHASCITAEAAHIDSALAQIGDYQSKIKRITWGIDLERFRPDLSTEKLKTELDIPVRALVFFDPRLATPMYNKHVILDAFASFVSQYDGLAVLIVAELFSDAAYAQELRRQAVKLGIADQIRYVGEIAFTDMPRYYALADATISIPISDGLPLTIFESLACGSFLILGNLPNYVGLIEKGLTGKFVALDDPQVLADVMTWVASQDGLRSRVVENGKRVLRKFADKKEQSRRVNEIYTDLIAVSS